jgi:hypothetical protein
MDWNRLHRFLSIMNWAIILTLSSASGIWMPVAFTGGVILGGLLAIANFHVLQHTIRGAFSPQGNMKKGKFSVIMKYYLRLFALGVLLYILLKKGFVDPVGLAVGVSIIFISIVGLGVNLALRTKAREAV